MKSLSYMFEQQIRIPDHRFLRLDTPFDDNMFMAQCHTIVEGMTRRCPETPIGIRVFDRQRRTLLVYGDGWQTPRAALLIRRLGERYSHDELQEDTAAVLLRDEFSRAMTNATSFAKTSNWIYFQDSLNDFSNTQKTSMARLGKVLKNLGVSMTPCPLHAHSVELSSMSEDMLLLGRKLAGACRKFIDADEDLTMKKLLSIADKIGKPFDDGGNSRNPGFRLAA